MERNLVQMRSLVRGVLFGVAVNPRDVIWVQPEQARHLIENKQAEFITGPAIARDVIPQETKPVEPEAKKSSADTPAGRSTDSAASGVSGAEALSRASRVAPASQSNRPQHSTLGLPKRK